jgi:hypothetical protein
LRHAKHASPDDALTVQLIFVHGCEAGAAASQFMLILHEAPARIHESSRLRRQSRRNGSTPSFIEKA